MTLSKRPPKPRRLITWLGQALLTVGAIAGAVSLIAMVLAGSMGIQPLVFRSGSMSPTINTGDLSLSRSIAADQLVVGDIVSVIGSDGVRVTHRVVEVIPNLIDPEFPPTLTLQGDANSNPDREQYRPTEVHRVFFTIPKAGYAVAWIGSSGGIFALGLLAGGMLWWGFGRRGAITKTASTTGARVPQAADILEPRHDAESSGSLEATHTLIPTSRANTAVLPRIQPPTEDLAPRHRTAANKLLLLGVLIIVAAIISALGMATTVTSASFTDHAKVHTETLSTATLQPPTVTCTADGNANTLDLKWSPVPLATHYRISWTQGPDQVIEAPTTSAQLKLGENPNDHGTVTIVAQHQRKLTSWDSSPVSLNYSLTDEDLGC